MKYTVLFGIVLFVAALALVHGAPEGEQPQEDLETAQQFYGGRGFGGYGRGFGGGYGRGFGGGYGGYGGGYGRGFGGGYGGYGGYGR